MKTLTGAAALNDAAKRFQDFGGGFDSQIRLNEKRFQIIPCFLRDFGSSQESCETPKGCFARFCKPASPFFKDISHEGRLYHGVFHDILTFQLRAKSKF